ncbi:MAG: hypothetical protein JNM93_01830 [Bacteriovoracaceae bacterium]|nr:hypothetical protein [Bacteriovoracaceae bacterium]
MTLTKSISLFFVFFALVGFNSDAKASRVKEYKNQRAELVELVSGSAKKVSYELGNDSIGEYVRVSFKGKLVDKLDVFSEQPGGIDSTIAVTADGDTKTLSLTIYTTDLEKWTPGENLQTSEGRSFPKFLDGESFDYLWGFNIKDGKAQFYLDPGYKVVGIYFNLNTVGNLISKVNAFKNKIPVLKDIIGDINSIPYAIKIKKQKVARIYALANDTNGTNSGFLLLIDHDKLKAAIKK